MLRPRPASLYHLPGSFLERLDKPAFRRPFPCQSVTFLPNKMSLSLFFFLTIKIPQNPGRLAAAYFFSCSSGGTKPARLANLRLKTEADDYATFDVRIVVVAVAEAVHGVETAGATNARGPQPPPGGTGLTVPDPLTRFIIRKHAGI